MYEYLLFLHVLMAAIWVGGAVTLQIYASRLIKENDALKLADFARHTAWIGQRVYAVASVILLIMGIWLVIDGPWEFSDAWVSIGMAGWGATFITGAFFIGPTAGKLAPAIEQKGAADPEVQRGIKRILAIGRIDLAVLILVIADMTIKPGM